MSNAAINWALTVKTGSATRKAVLMALANRADDDGVCWPSVDRIAADTELSDRAVQEALRDLAAAGIITRERRNAPSGVRMSDKYTLAAGRVNMAHPRVNVARGEGERGAPGRVNVAHPKPKEEPKEEPTLSLHASRADDEPAPPAKPSKDRGTRLPDGWRPSDETREWTRARMTSAAARDELDRFHDYWNARAGPGGVKRDWDATWRNWIRKATDDRNRKAAPRPGDRASTTGAIRAAFSELQHEWAHDGPRRDDDLFGSGADHGSTIDLEPADYRVASGARRA